MVAMVGETPVQAAFPGTNGRIFFDTAFGRHSDVYSVRPDGTGLRRLTNFPHGSSAFQARVSPDGHVAVFVVGNPDEGGQLWLMKTDGSQQHALTNEPEWHYASPAFDAYGDRVVVSRCGPYVPAYTTCHIVSMRLDGSGMRTIVGGTWHPVEPAVSPDGSTVAYASDKGGLEQRLWLVNIDGSNPRRIKLPGDPRYGVERFSWSPDGSHLAFDEFRFGGIDTAAVDGTHRQRPIPEGLFPGWSPGGWRISYLHEATGDLETAKVDGTDPQVLVSHKELRGIAFTDWGVAP